MLGKGCVPSIFVSHLNFVLLTEKLTIWDLPMRDETELHRCYAADFEINRDSDLNRFSPACAAAKPLH